MGNTRVARVRAGAAGLLAAATLMLVAGCTGGGGGDAPAETPDARTSSANPAPNDNDESQGDWAHLESLVLAKYPDAQFSQVGSSAQTTKFHLTPPTSPGTTGLVVAVFCRGGEKWTVSVDQAHPRTLEGSCTGSDAEVPDAVPLDDHATGVLYVVAPPADTRFWSVAFYTR